MDTIINLDNKNIVITGAGSGIGRESAIVASQQGANVIMLDTSEQGMADTLQHMTMHRHKAYVVNLSKIEFIPEIINEIIGCYGPINGLVHCAGISSRKPLNTLTKDGFSAIMDINFYSFVELVKLFTKKNNFTNGGSIVVMSSISSINGYKAKTEYCVSKASVDAFVRCMALELAPKKIRINSVMPAEVLTPMAVKAKELNKLLGTQDFNAPLGATEPYEIANLIAFLLSDATKTITGTSLIIDGGATV